MADTRELVLTDQWQQIGGAGAVYMEGFCDFCICSTTPAANNPRHSLKGDELRLPDGVAPWVRKSSYSPGLSRLTYTIFE